MEGGVTPEAMMAFIKEMRPKHPDWTFVYVPNAGEEAAAIPYDTKNKGNPNPDPNPNPNPNQSPNPNHPNPNPNQNPNPNPNPNPNRPARLRGADALRGQLEQLPG